LFLFDDRRREDHHGCGSARSPVRIISYVAGYESCNRIAAR